MINAKRFLKGLLAAGLVVVSASMAINSQTLPGKTQILAKMKLANDYFMKKWPDPCLTCLLGNRPSTLWTRAVYYEGNMAYYRVSGDTAALNHALEWATYHKWNFRDENDTTSGDQTAGQTYVELYNLDPKAERIIHVKTCIDKMVNSTKVNYWTFVDALQGSMPLFSMLGKIYGTATYYSRMYAIYNYSRKTIGLYDTINHLWWRDETFKPPFKTPNGKNCYWSRGNGWAVASLVRVLDILPATDSHRAEYEETFKEMMVAIKAVQRSDGFWNEDLGDPIYYGGPELTGTAFFIYGMAWGVNKVLLDRATYLPIITKSWNVMADSAIFSSGALGYVQGTGDSPGDNGSGVTTVSPTKNIVPDFDDYGLGCLLLAGSETIKLAPDWVEIGATLYTSNTRALDFHVHCNNSILNIANEKSIPMKVTLCDLQGRRLFGKTYRGPAELHLQSVVKGGVYIVRVEAAGRVVATERIVAGN